MVLGQGRAPDEFAALDQGEGWPFAILVACSVERGAGQGSRSNLPTIVGRSGKVSAGEFARAAGTSDKRVLRYLAAWERAAADGVVPDADTLSPGDAHDVPRRGRRDQGLTRGRVARSSERGSVATERAGTDLLEWERRRVCWGCGRAVDGNRSA